jgi:benzoylformate decarboxylase
LYGGSIARMTPAYRAALANHDLVISVGADLLTQSQAAGVEALPPGMPLVHLDSDAWEIGKNFPAAAAILGDPKATLPDLCAAVAQRMPPASARADAVATRLTATKAALVAKAQAEAHLLPLRPMPVIAAIGEMLPDDAIVIEEALSSGMNFIRHLIASNHPDSYFGMRGGGIGMGLPQAIGAALAKPGRPVVALSGDGSAMYSIQALWTAAHYRLPVIFIILNNRSYRILKQRTRAIGDHSARSETYVAMDFTDPPIDFVALAQAQGVAAVRVETLDALREALTRGLSANAPLLIDVVMDGTV